ncbi:granulocyte-macrophage colony-stimulating factor receptor subunit alpha-like [Thunnus thynnus]|uniref:granulocyte-macrophage colony-stimulating factor receptor subunit alpha-like n=1 Tax=Thunnus thynnus TaxID=8237 RepID=UPI003529D259
MKLIFGSSLLILFWFWFSQSETEASDLDVCPDREVESCENFDGNNISCFIYPTNILNCSWSFHTLQEDAQLFVCISICDTDTTVDPPSLLSEGRVGSGSMVLDDYNDTYVVLQFTTSNSCMPNKTVHSCEYEHALIEFLFPPNILVSVKDQGLLVTWDVPYLKKVTKSPCFEYELDMGDQEKPIHVVAEQSYTKPYADPTRTYRVRIRTKVREDCYGPSWWSDWSDWSDTVRLAEVKQSETQYSIPVIISISLGIPMILLAVLLLVRHQRVCKVLFPPIPRPPSKYKYFLEKNYTFNVPVPSAKPEEEITEVQDAEQNPGTTF